MCINYQSGTTSVESEGDKKTTEKGKTPRKNNEKRKEKSRDAARCRRSKETEIFSDLGHVLPLTQDQVNQLDKASIMRLAISFLRVREMIDLVPAMAQLVDTKSNAENEIPFLKSLDGFVITLSPDGDFIYVSENVSEYLGIGQIDLMGQSIYDYSHPCDHAEIKDILSTKSQKDVNNPKSFFIRLKCTLTNKGRSVNLKSASYKVIHCTGHIITPDKKTSDTDSHCGSLGQCFLGVGKLIPHPSNIDAPLPRQTFVTKHSLDMKFTHADDAMMTETLGYTSTDLIGQSFFEYHHSLDSDSLSASYKCLFSKGQCETNQYRFLAKRGGYVWIVTQATLIYDSKTQKPQSVVCVNFIISNLECSNEIFSTAQLAATSHITTISSADNNNNSTINNNNAVVEEPDDVKCCLGVDDFLLTTIIDGPTAAANNDHQQVIITDQNNNFNSTNHNNNNIHSPLLDNDENNSSVIEDIEFSSIVRQFEPLSTIDTSDNENFATGLSTQVTTATSKIFAPRTEEMNKGFLTFSEEEPGLTMLKDEPEDLTHLAPVAGDVCVPLDDHPFLSDMLEDFLLKDGFCPLLADDPSDPLIAYRDCYGSSPQLLSTNSDGSLPSLSSPSDSSLLSDEDQMSTFTSLPLDDNSDLEPILKSSFLPMSLCDDDLPIVLPDGTVLNTNITSNCTDNNNKNLRTTQTGNNRHCTDSNLIDPNSNLAQLLSSAQNKSNQNTKCSSTVMNGMKTSRNDNSNGGGVYLQNPSIYSQKSATTNWTAKTYRRDVPKTANDINNPNGKTILNQSPSNLVVTGTKRVHSSNSAPQYITVGNKRSKNDIDISKTDKISSELLQQLIANCNKTNNQTAPINNSKGTGKNNANWYMDTGGQQRAQCVSQPSDSVLMNLLGDPLLGVNIQLSNGNQMVPSVQKINHTNNYFNYQQTYNNNMNMSNAYNHMDYDNTFNQHLTDYASKDDLLSPNQSFYSDNSTCPSPGLCPEFDTNHLHNNDFLLSLLGGSCM